MDTSRILLSGFVTSTIRNKACHFASLANQLPLCIHSKVTEKIDKTRRKGRNQRCVSCDNEDSFQVKNTRKMRLPNACRTVSPQSWPKSRLEPVRPGSDYNIAKLMHRLQGLYSHQKETMNGDSAGRGMKRHEGSARLRVSGKQTQLARRLSRQQRHISPEPQRKLRALLPDISVAGWET